MNEIRLWYTQPGPDGFVDKYLTPILNKRHKVVLDPMSPQYVICSTAAPHNGQAHFDYPQAVKIFFTGENIIPDFNLYDYALGFHYLHLEDRYLRYPLWLLYLAKIGAPTKPEGSKFCNFVYSNNLHSDPVRSKIFDALNRYKPVDSAGAFRNTIGYRVGDKLEFIKDYKFTIAVENSSVPGYTTEKLLEPSLAGTMPIYWGDPKVAEDFNTERFVWVKSSSPDDIETAVEQVKQLDGDPLLYAQKMAQPIFNSEDVQQIWEDRLLEFFDHIFDQPHPAALRRATYGFNRHQTLLAERAYRLARSKWGAKAFGLIERLTNKKQKPTQKY